jgi:DNA-binding NarL/FixJ family response regulator
MGNGEIITVLIVDDHPLYRYGLKNLLEKTESIRVVGEATSGVEALSMVQELRPDLVLMDINLPGATGIETTKTLVGRYPLTSVVIVSVASDKNALLAAIRAGARGFLLKEAGSDEIHLAIQIASFGGLAFDSRASTWIVEHLTGPPASTKPFPELTDREREILDLIASGQGNAAIARELQLSVKTVRNYVSRIFAKLHLVNRTEAAVQARRAGLGN